MQFKVLFIRLADGLEAAYDALSLAMAVLQLLRYGHAKSNQGYNAGYWALFVSMRGQLAEYEYCRW